MYLVRTEFRVMRSGEFEAGIAGLGELRKGVPGYLGQTLLRSYSYPNKYVGTSRWQNVEAAWAFANGDVMTGYVKNAPVGVLMMTSQEGYESVWDVNIDNLQPNSVPMACEVLVDWVINPNAAAKFEASRHELAELRKTHVKGFVSARMRRSGGVPGRYLVLNIYGSVEDARASRTNPESQAFMQAHPYTEYAASQPAQEAFHVVHRM